jgi:hypothetical protein
MGPILTGARDCETLQAINSMKFILSLTGRLAESLGVHRSSPLCDQDSIISFIILIRSIL